MSSGFGKLSSALFLVFGLALAPTLTSCVSRYDGSKPVNEGNGVVRVKSGYDLAETVARIKADVAAKGITFFDEINQSQLASTADVQLRPSTLLVFGNPPLGTQFLTSNPESGLDWPVRVLVFRDADGQVWVAYTDFEYIRRRHHIEDRDAQFKMASKVIASITSTVQVTE